MSGWPRNKAVPSAELRLARQATLTLNFRRHCSDTLGSRFRVSSKGTRMRPLVAPAFFVTFTAALLGATPQPAQRATHRAPETALDRYVAAPDPNFAWKVVRELPAEGATATLIEMTSQKWLTEKEVEQPLWTHWLTVVRPEQ